MSYILIAIVFNSSAADMRITQHEYINLSACEAAASAINEMVSDRYRGAWVPPVVKTKCLRKAGG